jgi:Zn-dependent protease with chaperone function
VRTADRAFALVLVGFAATALVIALPLVVTLFPGHVQDALHGYDGFVRACVAAVYQIGTHLPPLGLPIVGVATFAVGFALLRAVRTLRRTGRLSASRSEVPAGPLAVEAARRVGLTGRLSCFAHPEPIAYTAGLLRPHIWVSTGLCERLDHAGLEAVLWHERAHLIARDPLRVLTARVLAALLFVVPWVGALVERYEVAKELEADREALRRLGSPEALAGALYLLGDRIADDRPLAIGAWSVSALRIDQLCGARAEALLPGLSRGVVLRSLAALTVALALTLGQAARANIVPAGLLEQIAGPVDEASVHVCPVPLDGILL